MRSADGMCVEDLVATLGLFRSIARMQSPLARDSAWGRALRQGRLGLVANAAERANEKPQPHSKADRH